MVINHPGSINYPLEVFIPLVTVELKLQGFHRCYYTINKLIDGISSMNKEELIAHIQSVIDSRYAGLQSAFAQDNGLSAAYVNDVLRSRREPGKKILDAVGAERVTIYRLREGD